MKNQYEISDDESVLGIYEGNSCYEAFAEMMMDIGDCDESTSIEFEWEHTKVSFRKLYPEEACGCHNGCMECLMMNY